MQPFSMRALLLGTTIAFSGSIWLCNPAAAQDADRLQQIEQQIQSLQSELARMRRGLAQRDAQLRALRDAQQRAAVQAAPTLPTAPPVAPVAAAVAAPPAAPLSMGGSSPPAITSTSVDQNKPIVRVGGVTATLGGFIELAGIFRSRNETADIASSFSGIPLANTSSNHENEFRESERQSRLSLLIQGKPDPATNVAAYFEADMLGAATTANSGQSNSYNPRIRHAYAQYDQTDWGLHVLAGQSWSLATMDRVGIIPRQENIPLTIDAQYVVGFNWLRVPQLRIAKDFDDQKLWAAISFESPQASYSQTGVPVGTVVTTNAGGSNYASTSNYSVDVAPDVVGKLALDPGWGHYELLGVGRALQTRSEVPGYGSSHVALAGGVGGNVLLPLIAGRLDVQGSVLAGYGIGRYGTTGLPDATVRADGSPAPLPEVEAMVGLVGHPTPAVDLYTYAGTEQLGRKSFNTGGKPFGYGNSLYSNAGCNTEDGSATCTANTSGAWEVTLGAWWRFMHGNYGTLMGGAQYEYVRRTIFQGVGGAPSANENVAMLSLRYLPFQ
jgi:hypothetical protein